MVIMAVMAVFQPYCKSELLVEVRRARVNRGGFRLVILVRLGATRKAARVYSAACLPGFTSLCAQ